MTCPRSAHPGNAAPSTTTDRSWVRWQHGGPQISRSSPAPSRLSLRPGKSREVLAYQQVFMLKTLKCPVRVVRGYRKNRMGGLVHNRSAPLARTDRLPVWRALEIQIQVEGAANRRSAVKRARLATYIILPTTCSLSVMAVSLTSTAPRACAGISTPGTQVKRARRLRPFRRPPHHRRGGADEDFDHVCPKPTSPPEKSLVDALLVIVMDGLAISGKRSGSIHGVSRRPTLDLGIAAELTLSPPPTRPTWRFRLPRRRCLEWRRESPLGYTQPSAIAYLTSLE